MAEKQERKEEGGTEKKGSVDRVFLLSCTLGAGSRPNYRSFSSSHLSLPVIRLLGRLLKNMTE